MVTIAELIPPLRQRFFDANGAPLVGGKLYTYVAGTTTPQVTYIDQSAATPNTNPVILDADGYADVWIVNGIYKYILKDSNDVTLWTIDNVRSLAAHINVAGALAVANNLSDVSNVSAALVNLGIAPFQYQRVFAFTNSQAASNLAGQTFDGTVYSAVRFEYQIIQGTTVVASGNFALHYKNGTWGYLDGSGLGDTHGLVFSLSQVSTTCQLRVAETGGLGDGTLKLKPHFFFT